MQRSSAAICIQSISSSPVAHAVLNNYRRFVQTTEGGTAGADRQWTAEQRALWKRLFGKYEGNLLLIDFWGLGCGLCRAGMLRMRDKVEAMKDDPIKFIYVSATDGESLTAKSEEWMNKNPSLSRMLDRVRGMKKDAGNCRPYGLRFQHLLFEMDGIV